MSRLLCFKIIHEHLHAVSMLCFFENFFLEIVICGPRFYGVIRT
jgi:hypothetical protein